MNEDGLSFVETMLAVSILFLILLTLIPFTSSMQATAQRHVASYYASEVAYNGALLVKHYGIVAGEQQLHHILYRWYYDGQAICTTYRLHEEDVERCIF